MVETLLPMVVVVVARARQESAVRRVPEVMEVTDCQTVSLDPQLIMAEGEAGEGEVMAVALVLGDKVVGEAGVLKAAPVQQILEAEGAHQQVFIMVRLEARA